MKYRVVGTLLLLLSCFMFAACGGASSQSLASSNSQSSNTSTLNTGSSAQTVNILIGDMYIQSDVKSFTVSRPYHFVVKNQGQRLHEFTIAKKVPGGNQASRDAASVKDMDNIEPGQTLTFDFTFKNPAPSIDMEFECSYPGHYEKGMHMDITVN